jgi:hypothetical protein
VAGGDRGGGLRRGGRGAAPGGVLLRFLGCRLA